MIFALIGGAVLRASHGPPNTVGGALAKLDSGHAATESGPAPVALLAVPPSLPQAAEASAGKSACEYGNSAHHTWAYLDGKCAAGKARKPRMVRVATDRPALAAVALGRTSALSPSTHDGAPATASVPAIMQVEPSRPSLSTPAEAATATEGPPRSATASKARQKTARRENRRRDPAWRDAPWWREVRAGDWARGYGGGGERDYGRSGYAREGFFGYMR